MARPVSKTSKKIREFILANVSNHPNDIAKVTAMKFSITRQAVNKHINFLLSELYLSKSGSTRSIRYSRGPKVAFTKKYRLKNGIEESSVWNNDIKIFFSDVNPNIYQICHHGFTEMFNNVIDHSEGTTAHVEIVIDENEIEMVVYDNGVGIFNKIQKALRLDDARHAVLELAKGKFTTDPSRHSGEGIFFTSKMFDSYQILSGDIYFDHRGGEDWIFKKTGNKSGTFVVMKINKQSTLTVMEVFDQFASSKDDFGFSKTIVPVDLALYGDDSLVSRSQAKRLLARFKEFKSVVLDFKNVESVGQAFADEIFRVFAINNSEIEVTPINMNELVKKMVFRALMAKNDL